MTTRIPALVLYPILIIVSSLGTAEAKRPIQGNDTIPPPAPPEIAKCTGSQFTVPRQSEFFPEELSHYLNGCPPVEVWFKITFGETGQRYDTMVYSSRPNPDIERVASSLMRVTTVLAPGDTNSAAKWGYHRVVLVAPGRIIKLDPGAIPAPQDLPRPDIAPDSGYVPAQLLERGQYDWSRLTFKAGFSGKVILRVKVAADGRVKLVRVAVRV